MLCCTCFAFLCHFPSLGERTPIIMKGLLFIGLLFYAGGITMVSIGPQLSKKSELLGYLPAVFIIIGSALIAIGVP